MNIVTASFEKMFSFEKRSASDTLQGLTSFLPFLQTEGAKKVNVHSSLTISAFYCAVNTLAESFAMLPHSIYQVKDNMRQHIKDHPADYLLYRRPNLYHSAFTFRFIMAVSVIMRGNAYALIIRNNAGFPVHFIFLNPDDVTVKNHNNKLWYYYKNTMYSADEILHIPGFSFDGISGKSILQYAADNMGIALSAQKFGSDSLHDRGISHGVLETDKSLDPGPKKRLGAAFSEALSEHKHRSAVLDEGMKYKPIALSPEEAKFIETYATTVDDVGRWFKMPAHKLGVKGEGGYNYLVQMEQDYLQRCVMPLGEKFRQEMEYKIFTKKEVDNGFYVRQNYKKLLQADPKARGQFYKDMVFLKAMNPNEIRELEDMNPYDGGNEFLQMSNLLTKQQIDSTIKDEA